jgi:rhamnose utilization protein RhaD (predicted bifunctional aldolase and dehydrogenase)
VLLEAILHAVVPYKYVDHAYADAVLAIANTPGGLERVREIYGGSVVVIPYARSGFPLAKLCAQVFSSKVGEDTIGLVLMQQGIVSFGETARVSYERMVDLVTRAEQCLVDRGARPRDLSPVPQQWRMALSLTRPYQLSAKICVYVRLTIDFF